MNRHRLVVALMPPLIGVSITVGAVYHWAQDATPPTPQPTVSVASPTPSPSHRPGVVPWESCTAHPSPSCPSDAPTGCPTNLDPQLKKYFLRQCP